MTIDFAILKLNKMEELIKIKFIIKSYLNILYKLTEVNYKSNDDDQQIIDFFKFHFHTANI